MKRYEGETACAYDRTRFRSLRGRAVDLLEWRLLVRSLRLLETLCGRKVGSLLDAPTGTGRMLRRLATGSRAVIGLDASPDMLSLAKAHGDLARYMLGAVEAIPLDDRSLDAVVSLRLFGHLTLEEKAAALREFSRVASMGAVVCYAGDSAWLRFRRARAGRDAAGTWHPATDSLMEEMARDAGLTPVGRLRLLGPLSETRALVLRTADSSLRRIPRNGPTHPDGRSPLREGA